MKTYDVVDYAYRLYEAMQGVEFPVEELPTYFIGAMEVAPHEHVDMLCAWQFHIDASISKTINCPTDLPFEAFQHLYDRAYEGGAKGCTTYRENPDAGRGSVLSLDTPQAAPQAAQEPVPAPATPVGIAPRPDVLEGRTYKVKWPLTQANWYVTITSDAGVPLEMFIVTKDASNQEWVTALSRTVTAILRRGGDVTFLLKELSEVHAATGGAFIDKRFRPSIVAAIGYVLEQEFRRLGLFKVTDTLEDVVRAFSVEEIPAAPVSGDACPACHAPTWVHENGCKRCLSCGHEACG